MTGFDSGTERLSVLLIDDHPLRRASVLRFLESMGEAAAVALSLREAATPLEAASRVSPGEAGPKVQVAVLGTGSMDNGMLALRELLALLPATPVVVLSDNDDTSGVIAALEAGAQGYICTRSQPALMLHALQFVAAGGSVFPPDALLHRFGGMGLPKRACSVRAGGDAAEAGLDGLTARQCDVLRLLREGQSNKRIARALNLREATVKVHVRQIMRRLGVANRTQAALMAALQPEDEVPFPAAALDGLHRAQKEAIPG